MFFFNHHLAHWVQDGQGTKRRCWRRLPLRKVIQIRPDQYVFRETHWLCLWSSIVATDIQHSREESCTLSLWIKILQKRSRISYIGSNSIYPQRVLICSLVVWSEPIMHYRSILSISRWWCPKIGLPPNHQFSWDFPHKSSVWSYPNFRKPPYISILMVLVYSNTDWFEDLHSPDLL